MKGRKILVSIVASLALVAVAPPAQALELSVGGPIGTASTGMGILCNALNVLGVPLCAL